MARTCNNCGGAMTLVEAHRYFHCAFCGGDEQPSRSADGVILLGESSGRSCPACDAALEKGAVGPHHLEHCPRCLGLLVPQRALRAIVAILWSDYNGPLGDHRPAGPPAKHEARRCPECKATLTRQPYLGGANVFMELCEACWLIWLDPGELRRIVVSSQAV